MMAQKQMILTTMRKNKKNLLPLYMGAGASLVILSLITVSKIIKRGEKFE